MTSSLDFGYPWWLNYGHLPVAAVAAGTLLIAYLRHWSKWTLLPAGALLVWSATSFVLVQIAGINTPPPLPTPSFFVSGSGRVLDLGAGTGRSSIMLLRARPKATLVALDLFGESFDQHFGNTGNPQDRLWANLRAAGVDGRASVQAGDMRKLPFESASFDAIVSSYAIDHLNRQGISQALAEAARVIKPHGDFLMMIVHADGWAKFAFGPLLVHSRTRGPEWWDTQVRESGFQIVETGTTPATYYVLGRRNP